MRVLIMTGGRIDADFALDFLKKEKFDHIIVVDGALAFWNKVENDPQIHAKFDHLVGDFDTISSDILKKYKNRGDIEVHQFVPEKDNTDTDIALKLAIRLCGKDRSREDKAKPDAGDGEEGFAGEILLLGATGTRADHMLANLQLLAQVRAAGLTGVIVDQYNRIRLIEGHAALSKCRQFGDYVSLIPVTAVLKGITLKGFKYPLNRRTVYWGDSLCVSNELVADRGEIEIEEGLAFLIESRD